MGPDHLRDERSVTSALEEAFELLIAQRLAVVAAEYAEREREVARVMYRRGYLAGRNAQRRGAPLVSNPERHARGDAKELFSR